MRENLIVSSRGQITLPVKMRTRLGIKPGSVVTIEEQNGTLVLRPAAVVEIEFYSEEQIAQWNEDDKLADVERLSILKRLDATKP